MYVPDTVRARTGLRRDGVPRQAEASAACDHALMTDPAQDAAARGALAKAAETLACDARDLIVREVVWLRRRDTKVPFYFVTIEQRANGTQLQYQVSEEGTRVEQDWPRIS